MQRPTLRDELDGLAETFARFARLECGESPLYRRLADAAAGDRDVLALAAAAVHGPKPYLLLAAVHHLLLSGVRHPLASFYPSLGGTSTPPDSAEATFRDFCLVHAEAIITVMAAHRVQTNEVARCAILLPAFATVAARTAPRPLVLVEVGTSAGLLLRWDRYAYDYGDAGRYGPESNLIIHCEPRGPLRPPLPRPLPAVRARTGIDLNPIDVNDPEQARWLRALIWPDQPERDARLHQAIGVARRYPVSLIRGDALAVLPRLVPELPGDGYLCLFHLHTLNQFSAEDRHRYDVLLHEQSRHSDLCDLAFEHTGAEHPTAELRRFHAGDEIERLTLARYDAHGGWLEWLDLASGERERQHG
jgi:hypothetical protein